MSHRIEFIRQSAGYSDLITTLSQALITDELVPFLGAGISHSAPSLLHLSPQLAEPLRMALREAAELVPGIGDWSSLDEHLARTPLEKLLDALQRTHGERALEYLSVLQRRPWNSNHSRLAWLASSGLLSRIVTLNFDLLLEEAVSAYGKSTVTECPLIETQFDYGSGPVATRILKPHGSFAPNDSTLRYLSATISEVGYEPSPKNEAALERFLRACSTLVVAGYSDNDWDIFPLLARLVPAAVKHVVWIQYAARGSSGVLTLPDKKAAPSLYERIVPWLDGGVDGGVLVVGDFAELLGDLCERANVVKRSSSGTYKTPVDAGAPQDPDNSLFRPDAGVPAKSARTLLALAMIGKSTGEASWRVLGHLQSQAKSLEPNLAWQIERTLSNAEHDRGRILRSIPHMRRVIYFKSLTPNPADGHDFVWLGYKYLCRVKRRDDGEVLGSWLLQIPINLFLGIRNLWDGSRMEQTPSADHGNSLASPGQMAHFYMIDLVHSWMTIVLFLGRRFRFLYRPVFSVIERLYARLASRTRLMEQEYWFLRYLEARIFSGSTLHDAERVLARLDELERSYQLTQNNIQLGNAFAYRALFRSFVEGDRIRGRQQLEMARNAWSRVGPVPASGARRLELFGRLV